MEMVYGDIINRKKPHYSNGAKTFLNSNGSARIHCNAYSPIRIPGYSSERLTGVVGKGFPCIKTATNYCCKFI
jgi:hypothetical protein